MRLFSQTNQLHVSPGTQFFLLDDNNALNTANFFFP